jgi:hypothetical protein
MGAIKAMLLAGVLLLPWSLGVVVWSTQAVAGAQDNRKAVSTWNIVGDDPGGGPPNQGDPPANTQDFGRRKTSLVAFGTLASSPQITSIALQEVCRFQFVHLGGLLESAGWRVRWTLTKGDAGGQCGSDPTADKGNLVAVRGNFVDAWAEKVFPDNETNEDRVVLCTRVSTVFGNHAGCSTHLDDYRPDAALQNANARVIVGFGNSGVQHYAGADLNLRPGQHGSDTPWTSYQELNLLGATHPNPGANEKIDYAMGNSANHWGPLGGPDCPGTDSYSDHCSIFGSFQAK